MEPRADGGREMPFRSGGFAAEEELAVEHKSVAARLVAGFFWLVTGTTLAVLLGIVGLFLYIGIASSRSADLATDSPGGMAMLRESVELTGCRYVDRSAEQVTVRFTNNFERRLERVVIDIEFIYYDEVFTDQRVSFADVEPGEERETLLLHEVPAFSETGALECRVDWVRAFETG